MASLNDNTVSRWREYVSDEIVRGTAFTAILDAMVKSGWTQTEADSLMRRVLHHHRVKASLRLCAYVIVGFVALAGSIGSYEEARALGGQYFIWYGGVLVGIVGTCYEGYRLFQALRRMR